MRYLQGDAEQELGAVAGLRGDRERAAERREPLADAAQPGAAAAAAGERRPRVEAVAVVADAALQLARQAAHLDLRLRRARVPHDVAQRLLRGAVERGLDRGREAARRPGGHPDAQPGAEPHALG